MKDVMIDLGCFFTMVSSAIEVYNRETTGYLIGRTHIRKIGRKYRKITTLEGAYPLQTAERKPSSVGQGNISAWNRARSAIQSLNFNLIGGYHSHTGEKSVAELSSLDFESTEWEFEEFKKEGKTFNNWLEIIIAIRKKEYDELHQLGWFWRDYGHKVGCTIITDPKTGFDLTIAGYWLKSRKRKKFIVEEPNIYVPWYRDYWYWKKKPQL